MIVYSCHLISLMRVPFFTNEEKEYQRSGRERIQAVFPAPKLMHLRQIACLFVFVSTVENIHMTSGV